MCVITYLQLHSSIDILSYHHYVFLYIIYLVKLQTENEYIKWFRELCMPESLLHLIYSKLTRSNLTFLKLFKISSNSIKATP